jgi:hypothetical protein
LPSQDEGSQILAFDAMRGRKKKRRRKKKVGKKTRKEAIYGSRSEKTYYAQGD